MVKFIISALAQEGINPKSDVAYATPTGKAAEALRKNGSPNACTIHKLLYEYRPVAERKFVRIPRVKLDYKLIICDEVSMISKEMIDLLLRHRVYVIFCGDPFQIPPISRDDENHLLDNPHIFLDEIMRQAADSEIIQLSMKIRNYEPIPFMNGKDVKVLPKNQMVDGMFTWADQVITATNNTRNMVNMTVRSMLGRDGGPQDGDKVICGKNYWDELSDNGNPLINGTIGYLDNSFISTYYLPSKFPSNTKSFEVIQANIKSEEDTYYNLTMDEKLIETGKAGCPSKTAWIMSRRKYTKEYVPKEFEYGYAITGHRSQGSQWEKVLIIEENFPFGREDHARWLYTAVTRSEDRLVLIRK